MADTNTKNPFPASAVGKPLKPKKEADSEASPPSTAAMVTRAIRDLNERGGSSTQSIKKFILNTYDVDMKKRTPFIRKFLRSAVEKGLLLQTKGNGANGVFKLPPAEKTKLVKKPKAPDDDKSKPVKAKDTKTKVSKPKGEKVAAKTNAAAAPEKLKTTKSKDVKPKTSPKKKTPVKKNAKVPATNKAKSPKTGTPKKGTQKPAKAKK